MADACAEDMAKVDEAIRQTALKGGNKLTIRVHKQYTMHSILKNKGYQVFIIEKDNLEIYW
jgi:hypothetical protein